MTLATSPRPDYYGYGNFTRYGEVAELVTARDDKYVIMNYFRHARPDLPGAGGAWGRHDARLHPQGDNYYKEFKEYKYSNRFPSTA